MRCGFHVATLGECLLCGPFTARDEQGNPDRNRLAIHAQTLPEGWKWAAVFTPPQGFETEWRAWLAQAQAAEEEALLGWWAHRARTRTGPDDEGDLLAA